MKYFKLFGKVVLGLVLLLSLITSSSYCKEYNPSKLAETELVSFSSNGCNKTKVAPFYITHALKDSILSFITFNFACLINSDKIKFNTSFANQVKKIKYLQKTYLSLFQNLISLQYSGNYIVHWILA